MAEPRRFNKRVYYAQYRLHDLVWVPSMESCLKIVSIQYCSNVFGKLIYQLATYSKVWAVSANCFFLSLRHHLGAIRLRHTATDESAFLADLAVGDVVYYGTGAYQVVGMRQACDVVDILPLDCTGVVWGVCRSRLIRDTGKAWVSPLGYWRGAIRTCHITSRFPNLPIRVDGRALRGTTTPLDSTGIRERLDRLKPVTSQVHHEPEL